jgi:hypothetical protein
MTETARRPVPHIQTSPELEAAAIAVTNAKDSQGNPVRLCQNPLDVVRVKYALTSVTQWFEDPTFFFADAEPGMGELAAVENLILLATLLREHLKAGNHT